MEEKRFATPQDVRLRLNETFLKYGTDYFYALQKQEDVNTNLQLYSITGKKHLLTIDANDPELDVSSLPLGYVQYPNWESAVFMSRLPFRRQNQSVNVNSVAIIDVWSGRQHLTSRDYFHQEGFLQNLQGNFPSYSGVITSVMKNRDKRISRAFDRCFCVLSDGPKTYLQYNCTEIGEINLETKIIHLRPEHNHSVFTMRLAELGAVCAD